MFFNHTLFSLIFFFYLYNFNLAYSDVRSICNYPSQYRFKDENIFLSKNNLTVPYTINYKIQKTELLYLAIDHTTLFESSTFDLIKKSICDFMPNIIMVEGISYNNGIIPESIFNRARSNCIASNIFTRDCSESLYTIFLADKYNIKVIGVEPQDIYIYNILKLKGYNNIDYIFCNFTRYISSYFKRNNITKVPSYAELNSILINYLSMESKLIKDTSLKKKLELIDYSKWLYFMSGARNFNVLLNTDFSAPIVNGNKLQILVSDIEKIRDKYILDILYYAKKKYNKILIELGASHYITQKKSLNNCFGTPIFNKAR